MSESKHTKGDWKVLKGAVEGDDMRCAVIVEQGKMQYLLATIENGAPGDFCETEEANARLIAAAPKLLEAYTAACTAADAILAPMTAEFGRIMEEAPNQLITLTLCSVEVSIPAKKFMELYRATARAALSLATGKDQ